MKSTVIWHKRVECLPLSSPKVAIYSVYMYGIKVGIYVDGKTRDLGKSRDFTNSIHRYPHPGGAPLGRGIEVGGRIQLFYGVYIGFINLSI